MLRPVCGPAYVSVPETVEWAARQGDQSGNASMTPFEVSCVSPEPSALMTQISVFDAAVAGLWKAIRLPSGDQVG